MPNETKPPVKRYRVGPGGVVERLEEAPPVLENEIQKELKKNGPYRHISGRKLHYNSSNSPLIQSSDSGGQSSLTEQTQKEDKKISKTKKNNFDKDLAKSWVIVICLGIVILLLFIKWSNQGISDTTVGGILPDSTQLFGDGSGNNALYLVKSILSFVWTVIYSLIGFLLKIIEVIFGF